MDCSKFRNKISPSLDSELSYQEQQDLKAHQSICPPCAQLLAKMKDIKGFLKREINVSLSSNFVTNLQDRIKSEEHRRPAWWKQLLEPISFGLSPISIATVAAAAISILLLGRGLLDQETAPIVNPGTPTIRAGTPFEMTPPSPSATTKAPATAVTVDKDSLSRGNDSLRRDFSKQIKMVNQ